MASCHHLLKVHIISFVQTLTGLKICKSASWNVSTTVFLSKLFHLKASRESRILAK